MNKLKTWNIFAFVPRKTVACCVEISHISIICFHRIFRWFTCKVIFVPAIIAFLIFETRIEQSGLLSLLWSSGTIHNFFNCISCLHSWIQRSVIVTIMLKKKLYEILCVKMSWLWEYHSHVNISRHFIISQGKVHLYTEVYMFVEGNVYPLHHTCTTFKLKSKTYSFINCTKIRSCTNIYKFHWIEILRQHMCNKCKTKSIFVIVCSKCC